MGRDYTAKTPFHHAQHSLIDNSLSRNHFLSSVICCSIALKTSSPFLYNIDLNGIRKAIYTTNTVESLNSVIRRVIKKRNVFPTDDSVFKVIWLAIKDASKKWTMPIQNWKLAMNRFMIDFGDRLDDHR
ncbi:transposase, Mutator family protein [Glaesserella parasuis MN-H]|nr:transposase, Mutator family protein [Glaesserella parasuis MN-H]